VKFVREDAFMIRNVFVSAPAFVAAVFATSAALAAESPRCPDGRAPIYLTFDTGSESQAELIHDVLAKHHVKATFFLANEKTTRGDWSLDPSWAPYWRELAKEGHAFGTHTFDHVYFRGDDGADRVKMRPQFGANAGKTMSWTTAQYCGELDRVGKRFGELTGTKPDHFWRAPGGKTSPRLLAMGASCGYRHFGWSDAGFIGDELPSERYPNAVLLDRALKNLKAGDITLMHLGIWSRKDPLATVLDPLISGLEKEGHCFRTLRDYPAAGAS
jgi:peptidoglycan/xylan/chitin deacetylase (PgdA/CDA1 family)